MPHLSFRENTQEEDFHYILSKEQKHRGIKSIFWKDNEKKGGVINCHLKGDKNKLKEENEIAVFYYQVKK